MKNWKLTIYKANNTVKKEFKILDRTEHEATNEAMCYMENFRMVQDWTLTPATKKQLENLGEIN